MKQLLTLSALAMALFITQPAQAQQQDNRANNTRIHLMQIMQNSTIANMMKMHTNMMNTMKSDTAVVHLTLKNFAFVPDTLRIPAGQPVKIILSNTGSVVHEFMAGKGGVRSDGDGFNKSLFQNVKIQHNGGTVEYGMMEMESMDMKGMKMKNMKNMNMKSMDMSGPFMIDVKPHKQASISFTLPKSKRGTWNMGCFIEFGGSETSHHDVGMKGVVIVE